MTSSALSRQIGKTLSKEEKTLALAESCTGGFISHTITSVPGSSAYFTGSVISYDNKIKTGVLGVKKSTIAKHGAVSAQCVEEMAKGIRKKFGADYALATSGIAGPTGAVKGKPVGTVFIALAAKNKLLVRRCQFKGNRKQVISQSARKALEMLWANL